MKEKVCVVVGPTATGKTAFGVALARHVRGEVISADSMQIYRKMDIGTAKPTVEEQQGIPHHMIDIIEPDEEYSVALYQKQAQNCITDILARDRIPVIVGGTGLYINSLTYDLDFSNSTQNMALRQELDRHTNEELFQKLQQKKAQAAERIHPNNRKRLIRALEIAQSEPSDAPYNFLKKNNSHELVMIGLNCDRQRLYQKIEQRVDHMITQGLQKEVASLYKAYGRNVNAMQAIGYKEWLTSSTSSVEEIVETIKRNTRRFAKRQITWFKRDDRIRWYDIDTFDIESMLADIDSREGESQ